jgi:2,4-dienoyl-CoA reductase-like NADH-dependent reductase (Old Yellow Enzyme family)
LIENIKGENRMINTKIFETAKLGSFTVKNKIARSATYSYLKNEDGYVSDDEINMYEELAKNNVGLIFTGQVYVSPGGIFENDGPSVHDDKYIPRLQELVKAVHSHGSKIVPQINHAGAKSNGADNPVSPSSMELADGKTTKALSIEEMIQIKEDFISAAHRVQQAGFDGVQVHAAHGYLLSEFISPSTNKRNDQYGGTISNRFRIVREIIEGIRIRCGKDFPIFIKINSNSEDDEVYEEELLYMLREFKKSGVTAVELSGYDWRLRGIKEHCYYIERAAKMREAAGIPIILVGGIRNLSDMGKVLDSGIDMVSLARPLISEPDLITKLIDGQSKADCTSCSKCFGLPQKDGRRCILHNI